MSEVELTRVVYNQDREENESKIADYAYKTKCQSCIGSVPCKAPPSDTSSHLSGMALAKALTGVLAREIKPEFA